MSKQISILFVLMTMLCLTLAACGNGGDGPLAVVAELFQRLEDHGFTAITELVCAASRDGVAELFGLGEFLDEASDSGVDPQQVADIFIFEPSVTFQEVAKSSDDATVRVSGSLNATVDAAKFKTLARQILEIEGAPDEERTDRALDQLYLGFAEDFDQEFSGRVDVDLGLIREDGKWLACHWGPPDRSAPTATPSRQVNLAESFTLQKDEAVVIAGTGLILHLEIAGHEWDADGSESVFVELTATLNGTSQRLYMDLHNAEQITVGDYTVQVLAIDGFGRGSCELRVVQQIEPATPTPVILADTFFGGCAYLDSNSNGELDPNDQPVEDALFVVTLKEGAGFGGTTTTNGCATIVVPGGLGEKSWPVTARMAPPEEDSYELVGSPEIVLEYPDRAADFLFANPSANK